MVLDRRAIEQAYKGRRFFNVETPYGKVCIRSMLGVDLVETWALDYREDMVLMVYCLVDPETHEPLWTVAELAEGIFDDMDAAFIRFMGQLIDQTLGYSERIESISKALDQKKTERRNVKPVRPSRPSWVDD